MFDWIPLAYYTSVHYTVLMLLAMLTLVVSASEGSFTERAAQYSSFAGFFLLAFVLLFMGTRPVSFVFGDMGNYAEFYRRIQGGYNYIITKEYIFNYFMVLCTKIMGERTFFFLCAALYTLPCYFFARKYGGSYWYFVLFLLVGSMMFWPFGTNGIRNGIATSLFLLALVYYERRWLCYGIMLLSLGVHSSMLIPIAAFAVSALIKNPKIYLWLWLLAIPLSLTGGSFWENFFADFGFGGDARAEDYLTKGNVNNDDFRYTGFRWDFLFYSAFAVFAGWYFIFKKEITDKFYIHLWGTYMIANAFWILVIRANFSNRFAYLSWFLMGAVIAYPLLKYKMFPEQYRIVGIITMIYFGFTYLMFLRG